MDTHSPWKHFLIIAALFVVGAVIYFAVDAQVGKSGKVSGGATAAQCNDHIDNDGDGFCDYAYKRAFCNDGSAVGDPQCSSKDDTTEADIFCSPNWQCTDWSQCLDGAQTRTCSDSNSCGVSTGKPSESQSCLIGGALDFGKVGSLIKYHSILTQFPGIDFDASGKKEFVVRDFSTYSDVTTLRVYENTSDNAYSSVFTLPIDSGGFSSYYPADVGDSDGDGKQELLVYGRTANDFYTRVYEGSAANAYPDTKVWQTPTGWWTVDASFADLDKDGKKEIVFGGQDFNYANKVQVFENNGDNSYAKVFESTLADIHTSQSLATFDDIDGDNKPEMAFCGLISGGTKLYLFENTGNDAYSQVWSADIREADGLPVNCENIVYAGDMDKDGRKEFAVGGKKSSLFNSPLMNVFFIFESTSDNTFQKIMTINYSTDAFGDSAIAAADLDGDGDNELVVASETSAGTSTVAVWNASGNNQFSETWSRLWTQPGTVPLWLQTIGVGDHDGDGKAELIFNEYNGSVSTSVYERTQ